MHAGTRPVQSASDLDAQEDTLERQSPGAPATPTRQVAGAVPSQPQPSLNNPSVGSQRAAAEPSSHRVPTNLTQPVQDPASANRTREANSSSSSSSGASGSSSRDAKMQDFRIQRLWDAGLTCSGHFINARVVRIRHRQSGPASVMFIRGDVTMGVELSGKMDKCLFDHKETFNFFAHNQVWGPYFRKTCLAMTRRELDVEARYRSGDEWDMLDFLVESKRRFLDFHFVWASPGTNVLGSSSLWEMLATLGYPVPETLRQDIVESPRRACDTAYILMSTPDDPLEFIQNGEQPHFSPILPHQQPLGVGADTSQLQFDVTDPSSVEESKDPPPVWKAKKPVNVWQAKYLKSVQQLFDSKISRCQDIWFDPLTAAVPVDAMTPPVVGHFYARPVFVVAPHLQFPKLWGSLNLHCGIPGCHQSQLKKATWLQHKKHGHGLKRSFVVLQMEYRCAGKHQCHATDDVLMDQLPRWLVERYQKHVWWWPSFKADPVPAAERKTAQPTVFVSASLAQLIFDTQDVAIEFPRVERLMELGRANHYLQVMQQYIGACERHRDARRRALTFTRKPPPVFAVFSQADDPDGYNEVRPPKQDTVKRILCDEVIDKRRLWIQRFMVYPHGEHLSGDHTFKVAANVRLSTSSDIAHTQSISRQLYLVLDEYHMIKAAGFTTCASEQLVVLLLNRVASVFKDMNKIIRSYSVDNCCHVRKRLQSLMKDAFVALDLWHLANRVIKATTDRSDLTKTVLKQLVRGQVWKVLQRDRNKRMPVLSVLKDRYKSMCRKLAAEAPQLWSKPEFASAVKNFETHLKCVTLPLDMAHVVTDRHNKAYIIHSSGRNENTHKQLGRVLASVQGPMLAVARVLMYFVKHNLSKGYKFALPGFTALALSGVTAPWYNDLIQRGNKLWIGEYAVPPLRLVDKNIEVPETMFYGQVTSPVSTDVELTPELATLLVQVSLSQLINGENVFDRLTGKQPNVVAANVPLTESVTKTTRVPMNVAVALAASRRNKSKRHKKGFTGKVSQKGLQKRLLTGLARPDALRLFTDEVLDSFITLPSWTLTDVAVLYLLYGKYSKRVKYLGRTRVEVDWTSICMSYIAVVKAGQASPKSLQQLQDKIKQMKQLHSALAKAPGSVDGHILVSPERLQTELRHATEVKEEATRQEENYKQRRAARAARASSSSSSAGGPRSSSSASSSSSGSGSASSSSSASSSASQDNSGAVTVAKPSRVSRPRRASTPRGYATAASAGSSHNVQRKRKKAEPWTEMELELLKRVATDMSCANKVVRPIDVIRSFQDQTETTRPPISVRKKLTDLQLLDLSVPGLPRLRRSGGPSVSLDPPTSPVDTEVDSAQPAPVSSSTVPGDMEVDLPSSSSVAPSALLKEDMDEDMEPEPALGGGVGGGRSVRASRLVLSSDEPMQPASPLPIVRQQVTRWAFSLPSARKGHRLTSAEKKLMQSFLKKVELKNYWKRPKDAKKLWSTMAHDAATSDSQLRDELHVFTAEQMRTKLKTQRAKEASRKK